VAQQIPTSEAQRWAALRAEVEAAGNLLTVDMGRLRDTAGYDKLGSNVRAYIKSKLASVGLKFWSEPGSDGELPNYQDELVRLYVAESAADLSYRAHMSPGADNDQFLRQQLAGDESKAILMRIRELLPPLAT